MSRRLRRLPPKPYTVWRFQTTVRQTPVTNDQMCALVAARTKVAARRAFGTTPGVFNSWAAETANEEDVAVAVEEPGTVFFRSLDDLYGAKYRRAAVVVTHTTPSGGPMGYLKEIP